MMLMEIGVTDYSDGVKALADATLKAIRDADAVIKDYNDIIDYLDQTMEIIQPSGSDEILGDYMYIEAWDMIARELGVK